MKTYFPGNTGPGDHTTKEVVLNYLTWYLFQSFCLLVSGTVPILTITKYFSCNYIEASVTWQGESFVLFFPQYGHYFKCSQLWTLHFSRCFYHSTITLFLLHPHSYLFLTDSCSWNHFLHILYSVTLNLTLHWPLCKVRIILLLKKRENGRTNSLCLSIKYIWSDLQHIRTVVA